MLRVLLPCAALLLVLGGSSGQNVWNPQLGLGNIDFSSVLGVENPQDWSTWSGWSPCSVTCGEGTRTRTRFCINTLCKDDASDSIDTQPCNESPCDPSVALPVAPRAAPIVADSCGGNITESNGVITSPGYPSLYGKNLKCVWSLTAPEDHYIEYHVLDFEVQESEDCRDDSLLITDVRRLKYDLCGTDLRRHDIFKSSGRTSTVTFTTDGIVSLRGFEIEYKFKAIPNCDDGDNYCYNGGTCNGRNVCECRDGFLGYRCSYRNSRVKSLLLYPHQTPKRKGTCAIFGLGHAQLFSGEDFEFLGTCQYVLSKTIDKTTDGSFEILIRMNKNCRETATSCVESLTLSQGPGDKLTIDNSSNVFFGDTHLEKDTALYNHYMISQTEHHLFVSFEDHELVIDKEHFSIFFTPDESVEGNLEGICGNLNLTEDTTVASIGFTLPGSNSDFRSREKDLQYTLNEFVRDELGEVCITPIVIDPTCFGSFDFDEESVCRVLLTPAFAACHSVISPNDYLTKCMHDMCQCNYRQRSNCHCAVVSKYARDCANQGVTIGNWRTGSSCGRTCPGGKVYEECVSFCPSSCDNLGEYCRQGGRCNDGCECPHGTHWNGDNCVKETLCPCPYMGHHYEPGTKIRKNCQEITCEGGRWNTTALGGCKEEAIATGFGHFRTLDGSWFNFPASECKYLFAEDCRSSPEPQFSVYVSVEHCGKNSMFSCIRQVHISHKENNISTFVTLEQNGKVLIQNHLRATLPTQSRGISVRRLSSKYIEAVISTTVKRKTQAAEQAEVKLLWDGRGTLHFTVSDIYTDMLCGLVGTYNHQSTDDYIASNGLESTATVFANSWKISPPLCPDVATSSTPYDACALFSQLEADAAEKCSILLTGDLFQSCRELIPAEHYYKICMQDACACDEGTDCMCSAISLYANQCLNKGIVVDWRSPQFCHKECPVAGQSFKPNTTLCERTCRSRAESETCSTAQLVEGCTCDDGLYLSNDGECVELAHCPCYVDHEWIPAAHVTHFGNEICTCWEGINSCRKHGDPHPHISFTCPEGLELRNCSEGQERGAECANTCGYSSYYCPDFGECVPGCVCPEGLFRYKDTCVAKEDCPCDYNGKTYSKGEFLFSGCARWECMGDQSWWSNYSNCHGTCRLAGGMYYTTFDGRRYDYRGTCEYLFASDDCSAEAMEDDTFWYRVTVKSRDCQGSNQAMCDTTVHIVFGMWQLTLSVRKLGQPEAIINRQAKAKFHGTNLQINDHGIYRVIKANIYDHTIFKLVWDRKASVYMEMIDWTFSSTCGLCGYHDGWAENDFRQSSGAVVPSTLHFANSWKTSKECPDLTTDIARTCGSKKAWAQTKCLIIYEEFTECRDTVSPDYFYDKCVRETCSCDSGGDCDCFCNAVADYAFECGYHGVTVEWRSTSACPLMCESMNVDDQCVWRYEPVAPPCETMCCSNETRCPEKYYEGCYPHCEDGLLFDPDTSKCVEPMECKCNKTGVPKNSICKAVGEGAGKNCSKSVVHPTFRDDQGYSMTPGEILMAANCPENRTVHAVDCKHSTLKNPQGIECDALNHGFLCTDTADYRCADFTLYVDCCECYSCDDITCPDETPPTCDVHQTFKSRIENCCPVYDCECTACNFNGERKEPGSTWSVNCTAYTCEANGQGCYNVTGSPHPCLDQTCPDYARKVPFTPTRDQCCAEPYCECRPEYDPAVLANFTCNDPFVVTRTPLREGDLRCESATCGCPDNTDHCVTATNCSADGCYEESTTACGCLTEHTCACDPGRCPTPEPCAKCYESHETRAGGEYGSTDACETGTCCPTYECRHQHCDNGSWLTCEHNQTKVNYTKSGDCCPRFTCVCVACTFQGALLLPGESKLDGCDNYTCVSDGADCYHLIKSDHWCPEEKCPYFAHKIKSVNTTHGGCCEQLNCACNAEYDPDEANALRCQHPREKSSTVVTERGFQCKNATCTCPNGTAHCTETANCTSDGCREVSTHDCGCPITSECACDPSKCDEPQTCGKCYTRNLTSAGGVNGSVDACNTDSCCPKYECLHVFCNDSSSVECGIHEEKINYTKSGDCCPTYECKCTSCAFHNETTLEPGESRLVGCYNYTCLSDGGDCYETDKTYRSCPVEECPHFAYRIPSTVRTHDGCCDKLNCNCSSEYDPAAAESLSCDSPMRKVTTDFEEKGFLCQKAKCVCPNDTSHCVEQANCSADGCHHRSTTDCGCITSSECVCDPLTCPPAPPCNSSCYKAVPVEGSTTQGPDACASHTCCPEYRCEHVHCDDGSDRICEPPYALKQVGELNECCKLFDCVCTQCELSDGTYKDVSDFWYNDTDTCILQFCQANYDGCPFAEIFIDFKDHCAPEGECQYYEDAHLYQYDACCKKNNCTCNKSKCDQSPTCSSTQITLWNEGLYADTDGCCNNTCCAPMCEEEGRLYRKDEVWNQDTCQVRYCHCEGCHCYPDDVPSSCPEEKKPNCPASTWLVPVENPEDPCCPKFECQCLCIAFGDPHYWTFDQLFYDFMGRCHYTLVKYRTSDRLHIYTDNSGCKHHNPLISCLKRVYVEWDGTTVMLYHALGQSVHQSVHVDGQVLPALPWQENGLVVSAHGQRVTITIPEIELKLIYDGSQYYPYTIVFLPLERFRNKTVGLCGSCSLNKWDDFEGPQQRLRANESDFGYSWHVNVPDEDKAYCPGPNTTLPLCPNASIPCCAVAEEACAVISSPLFDECASLIDLAAIRQGCMTDALAACLSGDPGGVCNSSSIETVAKVCQDKGVCVRWREELNCSEPLCPADGQEFKSCVRSCQQRRTCQNYMHPIKCGTNPLENGCFCQEGYVLKREGSDECVPIECCRECQPKAANCLTDACQKVVKSYDVCGCEQDVGCECNVTNCPPLRECDNCSTRRIIEPTPTPNICDTCCDEAVCDVNPCVPDWRNKVLPKGHRLVEGECCPYPECYTCIHAETGAVVEVGDSASFNDSGGCSIRYTCSNMRYSNSCHVFREIDNPRNRCKSYEAFASECKADEDLVPASSSDPCCANYTCTCRESARPLPAECNHPGGYNIMVPNKDSRCYDTPACNCTVDMLELQNQCPSYNESVGNCTKWDEEVEMVREATGTGANPCCPVWQCSCRQDCQAVEPPYCPNGTHPVDMREQGACCPVYLCKCDTCVWAGLSGLEEVRLLYPNDKYIGRDENDCEYGVRCLNTKIGDELSCYEEDVYYHENDTCLTLKEYEDLNCNLTDQYAVLVSTKGCCPKYECECDMCPPVTCGVEGVKRYYNESSLTACCPKEYCECRYPDKEPCDDFYLQKMEGIECPICNCPNDPTNCSYEYPNCTKSLGCKVQVTEQDSCGCPKQSECVCNPQNCPEPEECDRCHHLVTVNKSSSSVHEKCDSCCDVHRCVLTPCDPDYNVLLPPSGYRRVYNESTMCCPAIECAACFLEDGRIVEPGRRVVVPDEDGCPVRYLCTDERYGGGATNSCHIPVEDFNPRSKCRGPDDYQCKKYEEPVEVNSTDPCCKNYSCVCVNDPALHQEHCPGYQEAYDECENDTLREVVATYHEGQCCPTYDCQCKKCGPVRRADCDFIYEVPEETKDACNCTYEECKCDACLDKNGTKRRVWFENWNDTDSEGCLRTYYCPALEHLPGSDCYAPEARPCPVVTPKPGYVVDGSGCCPVLKCVACFLPTSGHIYSGQRTMVADPGGCEVLHVCTDKIDPVSKCYVLEEVDNPRNKCKTEDEFAEECELYEVLQEVNSTDPCCSNFSCSCVNDSMLHMDLCPGYQEAYGECENDTLREVVATYHEGQCCPTYDCQCKKCGPVRRADCDLTYEVPEETKDACNCTYEECKCDACLDRNGTKRRVWFENWNDTDSEGCLRTYYCPALEHLPGSDCYAPEARPCPVVTAKPGYVVDDSGCCPVLKCVACFLPNGSPINPGKTAEIPDEEGCPVQYFCSFNRETNDSCYALEESHNPRNHCRSREDFAAECRFYENLVEANYTDPCCDNYTCVCREPEFSSTPVNCSEPGMVVKHVDEKCYTCGCSDDLPTLDDECPKRHTVQQHCVGPNSRVQHHPSVMDSQHECCPLFECHCDRNEPGCDEGYKEVDVKAVESSCSLYACACDSCLLDNGTLVDKGSLIDFVDEFGCVVSRSCSNIQVNSSDPLSCYKMKDVRNPKADCLTREQYESRHCHSDYEHAVALNNGKPTESSPCCVEYKCVCNPDTVLGARCPHSNVSHEVCVNEEGRKNITYDHDCCVHPQCDCYPDDQLDEHCSNSSLSCQFYETRKREKVSYQCCPLYYCECKDCPASNSTAPEQIEVNACQTVARKAVEENPRDECCPEYKAVCDPSAKTPLPDCPQNTTALELPYGDPDTEHCCNRTVCRCDVCEFEGSTYALDSNWTKTVFGECRDTYTCTGERMIDGDLASCHKPRKHPKEPCLSQLQYGEQHCLPYEFAVTSEVDTDPCCQDYECQCNDPELLATICPNYNISCGEFEASEEVGKLPYTKGCCPENKCFCKPDAELKELCDQWDDFKCEPGFKLVTVEARNNETGPCCPKYNCVCDKCVHDGGLFPVNVTFALREDICTVGECVIDGDTGCPAVEFRDNFKCDPNFDEESCLASGGNVTTVNCCPFCDLGKCQKRVKSIFLTATIDGVFCSSLQAVNVSYCEGPCSTVRRHNDDTGAFEGPCKCCKETGSDPVTYEMDCTDNQRRSHEHREVVDCSCLDTTCESPAERVPPSNEIPEDMSTLFASSGGVGLP